MQANISSRSAAALRSLAPSPLPPPPDHAPSLERSAPSSKSSQPPSPARSYRAADEPLRRDPRRRASGGRAPTADERPRPRANEPPPPPSSLASRGFTSAVDVSPHSGPRGRAPSPRRRARKWPTRCGSPTPARDLPREESEGAGSRGRRTRVPRTGSTGRKGGERNVSLPPGTGWERAVSGYSAERRV